MRGLLGLSGGMHSTDVSCLKFQLPLGKKKTNM